MPLKHSSSVLQSTRWRILSLENLIFFAKTYPGGGFLSFLPRCIWNCHQGGNRPNLDKADKEVLGHAAKVVLTKDSTAIVGDGSIQEAVNKRVAQIRNLIAAAEQDYEKEKVNERIAKLSGGVAVIQVGAQTETELKEKKLGVEDTLNATKVAVEEGIVVGGGCTLLRLASKVDAIKETLENDEEKVGADIVKRAMSYPLKLIAKNAGVNGSVVSEKSKHGLEIKQVARLGRTSYHVSGLIEAHVNNIMH
ncbi:UNVERIFIED_CONTAM: RuBisCO large subunit-binding protein subunit beta, chloroplastic [Sesamum radiatum]|uniref:RuBisCO large subunit-binding protein subunit beta, chloroplastic n=1 Tax=Sesamum radiatum TaxID=300843 RepID=A0AAW2PLZ3_SESRA